MSGRARRRIGVGVIGFGWLGQAHSRSLLRIPTLFGERAYRPAAGRVQRRAAPARVDDAVSSFGFQRGSVDWRAVVEDPDVDAVCIAAPNMVHGRARRAAAAAAGKPCSARSPSAARPSSPARRRARRAPPG